jgi:hypothetical protein
MKTLLKIIGATLTCLILLLVILRFTGFEPKDCPIDRKSLACRMPGLWLRGNVVSTPVADWSFADKFLDLKLETHSRFLLPHSVATKFMTHDGQLYVSSTYPPGIEYPHGRSWNENVARDPHVRIKLGDQLYSGSLVRVTDPAEQLAALQAKAKRYPAGSPYWSEWKMRPVSAEVVFRVAPE